MNYGRSLFGETIIVMRKIVNIFVYFISFRKELDATRMPIEKRIENITNAFQFRIQYRILKIFITCTKRNESCVYNVSCNGVVQSSII